MKYNTRKWNPWLMAIPDIGIGLVWGSLGNVISFHAFSFTDSALELAEIFSAAAVIGVLSQIIVGFLSDKTKHKWGRRSPWVFYGMLLAGLSIPLWDKVSTFNQFLLACSCTMLAVNVAQCAYYTMLMEVVDKDQVGMATSLARSSGTIGGFLMSLIAGFLWDHKHPMVTFIIMGAIIIATTVFIIPFVVKEKPSPVEEKKKGFQFSLGFIQDKNILMLFFATFFFFSANLPLVQMATAIFVNHYHFTEHVVGKLGLFQAISSLIFGFGLAKYIDKISHKGLMLFATAGLTVMFAVLTFALNASHAPVILYVAIFVYGIFFVAGLIAVYTLLFALAPSEKLGEYMGILNLFIALPQLIFVNLLGEIIDNGYHWLVIPLSAGLYLLAFIMTTQLKIPKKIKGTS